MNILLLSEAQAVVAGLQAFKPWPQIPESTQDAWATALLEYKTADALEAIPIIGKMSGFLSLDVILETIEDCHNVRMQQIQDKVIELLGPPLLGRSPCDDQGSSIPPRGPFMLFRQWLDELATDDEKRIARRSGLQVTLARAEDE